MISPSEQFQTYIVNPNDRNLRILITSLVKYQDEIINDKNLQEARERGEIPFDNEGCGFSLDARISTIENHLQSLKEVIADNHAYAISAINALNYLSASIGTSDCAIPENADW